MPIPTDTNKETGHHAQFDGLRGFAIIFVVLCHCRLLIHGGWIVDGIFFTLAGFFIINPFKDRYEQRFGSLWGILKFYKSRLIRILPAYYLILLGVYFLFGTYYFSRETFISLLYFGDNWGTLWFMYAYFWIMFIIPYILLLHQFLAKKIKSLNNDLVNAVIFLILGGIVRLVIVVLKIYDLRLDQLLTGIAAGYLCRYLRSNAKLKSGIEKHKVTGDIVITLIAVLIVLFSSGTLMEKLGPFWTEDSVGHRFIYITGIVMSLMIILLAVFPNGIPARLLSTKPIVFLGKHCYTIYLIHIFVMLQLDLKSDFFWFLCTFSVSLVLAYLIDTVISFVIDKCKLLKSKSAAA